MGRVRDQQHDRRIGPENMTLDDRGLMPKSLAVPEREESIDFRAIDP